MNAVFLRELEKKEKAGGSSSASKKQVIPTATTNKREDSFAAKKSVGTLTITKKKVGSSSSAQKRAHPADSSRESDSPPSHRAKSSHFGKNKTSTSPTPLVERKGKQKLSVTSITLDSSQETPGSDGVYPSGPGIYDRYTPESAIVGRGPNSVAQKLLFHLPSHTDEQFLNSLGWSDLTRRTCSSFTEGIMYLGELVERADIFRANSLRDVNQSKTLQDQLQATIEEARVEHARELNESQARSDELLRKKEEELQQLKRDHTIELQKLKIELKASLTEAARAKKDLDDAKTQFTNEAYSIRKDFLKSEEFNEICGPKAFRYLEVGFEGTVSLFKAQGYPPEGAPTDFINLRDIVASLPPDL